MSVDSYKLERAIRRFTEPNWCHADGICECENCLPGRVLAEEVKKLQTEVRDWKEKAEHWKTRYDREVRKVRHLEKACADFGVVPARMRE